MSTCTHSLPDYPPTSPRVDYKHDLSLPISAKPSCKKRNTLHEVDESFNRYLLTERESHGKRTVIRVCFEVYCRKSSANMNFARLRNRSMMLNLPSSEQAELVMETIRRVVESMDGKLLTKG